MSTMTEQEIQNLKTDARLFYLAAPVMLPLIEKKKKMAYERLMMKHREGSTEYHNIVAELAVLTDLEREINNKEQTYRAMEENVNGNRKK